MSLPDDILVHELFPRIKDMAALFRCATACKRWCRLLVSDRAYLQGCLPEEACRSAPFTGIFTQQQIQKQKGRPMELPVPCFVPGPRPVLGPRAVLSSFVAGMGNYAVPLTSRHGLLLVRVGGGLLIVCNPLSGTFHALPHLEIQWDSSYYSTCYALLTAADCSRLEEKDQFPFFKVMINVIWKDDMHYNVYTYSSVGKSGWDMCSRTPSDVGRAIQVKLMQPNAVVHGGAAHWFLSGTTAFYFLEVSAKASNVTTRKLIDRTLCNLLVDPNYDEPYFSVDAEGRLAFLSLRLDCSRLDIRTCDSNETYSYILLGLPSNQMNKSIEQGELEHTCLGEKNGMLTIKSDNHRVYVANIKTGAMQEITDFPRGHGLSRKEIVPFEMDWPALFVSRLGIIAT